MMAETTKVVSPNMEVSIENKKHVRELDICQYESHGAG